jgi:hypothetical protein
MSKTMQKEGIKMLLTRLRIAGWAVLGTLLIALFATEFTSTAGPSKAGLSVRLQRGNLLQIVAKEPGIKVELYSLAGHRITEGHSTTNQLSLELPRSLANGVYLYVATANQDGRMRRVVGKIVVLRGRALYRVLIQNHGNHEWFNQWFPQMMYLSKKQPSRCKVPRSLRRMRKQLSPTGLRSACAMPSLAR